MARALGPEKCIALPVFHAFTGCDTVSSFAGRGKKTAWDTWKAYEDVTGAFCALAACPSPETIELWLKPLERFVVLLYDRTGIQGSVNEARKELFTRKGRAIDAISPTQAALMQHIKRTAYQAGHCWSQVMIPNPEIPSPNDWGWSKKPEGGWEACWTTLPEASQACRELVCCGCKEGCRVSADWLPCSVLLFAIVAGLAVNDKYMLDFNYYYYYVCTIKGAIATILTLFLLFFPLKPSSIKCS